MEAAVELEIQFWMEKSMIAGEDPTPEEAEQFREVNEAFEKAARECSDNASTRTFSSTPTPSHTPITTPESGPTMDGRFLAPEHNSETTYRSLFDRLTHSEQECVRGCFQRLFRRGPASGA